MTPSGVGVTLSGNSRYDTGRIAPVAEVNMSSYRKLRQAVAELGILDATLYAASRTLPGLWRGLALHKYIFVAQPVASVSKLPAHRGQSIKVRLVEEGDPVLESFPVPSRVIAARYRQGATCMAAFREEKLVCYAWTVRGPYQEDEVRSRFVPLPAGSSAWDFDVYVAPAERLGMGFSRLWDAVNEQLARSGVHWTMSRISAFNAPSLRSHTRLGARKVGSATYLVIGKQQVMFATIPPFVHFSRRADKAPALRIRASS